MNSETTTQENNQVFINQQKETTPKKRYISLKTRKHYKTYNLNTAENRSTKKAGLPVILKCIWRKQNHNNARKFTLIERRLIGFANRARSNLYHLSLDLSIRGAVRKGDRITLCGNYEGVYRVIVCKRRKNGQRALLQIIWSNN